MSWRSQKAMPNSLKAHAASPGARCWAMQWASVTHEQPSTTSYTEIHQVSLFCNRYPLLELLEFISYKVLVSKRNGKSMF